MRNKKRFWHRFSHADKAKKKKAVENFEVVGSADQQLQAEGFTALTNVSQAQIPVRVQDKLVMRMRMRMRMRNRQPTAVATFPPLDTPPLWLPFSVLW